MIWIPFYGNVICEQIFCMFLSFISEKMTWKKNKCPLFFRDFYFLSIFDRFAPSLIFKPRYAMYMIVYTFNQFCITKKPLGLPFFYILTKKCFVNFTLIYKLYEIKIHKISTFSKIEKTVLHLKYAYNALLFILNFMPVNYRTVWSHNYPFDLFISEFQIWILNCI